MNFPADFTETTTAVPADKLGEVGEQDVARLAELGYEVHYGLTVEFANAIAQMALEPAIKEYCPNDSGKRFANLEATANWLTKKRATFLLLKRVGDELKLVGYGWTGDSSSSHVPSGEVTFSIRIGEDGQGQGLATPFSRLIVLASAVVFGAKNFWLETWQSNAGAVHIYHKIGFEDVAEEQSERLTGSGEMTPDTRIYMSLPNSLLPPTN